MKTSVIVSLIAGIPNLSLAKLEYGQFGGCLNRTAVGTDNANMAFHCHFDSTFCLDGEDWLDTASVANEGFGPCTCDDDYNNNVFSHGCYDMENTHAVECSATVDQCPEGWLDLGSRFNSGHSVNDDCGHSDAAFSVENSNGGTDSCGKRCTCNFEYQSRDTVVTVGSTQYGMCYDNAADSYYCALKPDHCASSEVFYAPHSGAMSDTDCNCDDVFLGGCMDGIVFSHCAVDVDNCGDGQIHLNPRALRESVPGMDCRLCRNSWDEDPPTVPVSPPVKPPVTSLVSTPVSSPVSKSESEDSTFSNPDSEADPASDDDDTSSARSLHNSILVILVVSLFSVFLF